MLLAFRRGVLVLALAVCLLPLHSPPAAAADLWQREDQRRHAQLREGLARYEARDYEAALGDWQDLPGADAAYNRGNALARLGRYPEAVAEYDRALELRPGMLDAVENRRIVLEAMRKPPRPKDSEKKPPEQGQGKSGSNDQNKGQGKSEGQDKGQDQSQNQNQNSDDPSRPQDGQAQDRSDGQGSQPRNASERRQAERDAASQGQAQDGAQDSASGQPPPRPQPPRDEAAQAAERADPRGAGKTPQPARDGG